MLEVHVTTNVQHHKYILQILTNIFYYFDKYICNCDKYIVEGVNREVRVTTNCAVLLQYIFTAQFQTTVTMNVYEWLLLSDRRSN